MHAYIFSFGISYAQAMNALQTQTLTSKACSSMNFQWICKILLSNITLKSQEKGDLTKGALSVSLSFSI